MYRNALFPLAFAALALGCAPIEKQQVITKGSSTATTAGVGEVVARVERTRDLKNAFGAADIWGRKTNEGYSEVRFAGIEQDGTVVLYRQDLDIVTDEDVFTRSGIGFATTNASGTATLTGNSVHATGSSTTIYSQPRQASQIAIPSGAFPIRIPPGTTTIPFEGSSIVILDATPVALTYRVER